MSQSEQVIANPLAVEDETRVAESADTEDHRIDQERLLGT